MPPLDAAEDTTELSRLATSWPERKRSTYGSAARIPPASGSYSGCPFSGLTHTTANACRASRCHLARRRASASPRSQPSDSDHDDRAARQRAPAPLVVVGLERRADPRAARPVDDARAAARERRVRVARARAPASSRVRRVPNANVSTPRPEPRRRGDRGASAREYASIEPETSRSSTSLRGDCRGCGTSARPGRRRSRATRGRASARRASARDGRAAGDACAAAAGATAIARISRSRTRELLGRHRREVRVAQHLVVAPGADLGSPPSISGPGPGGALPAFAAAARGGRARAAAGGRHGGAEEPRVERAVERLEVLAARDERLPQRPVDVVLPRRDRRGRGRVSASATPPGPDLEAGLAQHAAEDDDVPDDARARRAARRARPRASARERLVADASSPRGTSAPSRASPGRSPRRAPARPSAVSALRPVDRLRDAGGFCRSSARSSATKRAACAASRSGTPGTRSSTISISRARDGCPIQW